MEFRVTRYSSECGTEPTYLITLKVYGYDYVPEQEKILQPFQASV